MAPVHRLLSICFACLASIVMAYGANLVTHTEPVALAPGVQSIVLQGNQGRYVILEKRTRVEDAAAAFARGEGQPFPEQGVRTFAPHEFALDNKDIFLYFSYRNPDHNLWLQLRRVGIHNLSLYTFNASTGQWTLRAMHGTGVPWSESEFPYPSFMLPLASGQPTHVIIRVDSVISVSNQLVLAHNQAFHAADLDTAARVYLFIGFVAGLAFIGMVLAWERKSLDFVVYVVSVATLGLWQSIYLGGYPIIQDVWWRKFQFPGLLFVYLIMASFALHRLLQPPGRRTLFREMPISIAIVLYTNLFFAGVTLYWAFQPTTQGLGNWQGAFMVITAIASPLMLTFVVNRARRQGEASGATFLTIALAISATGLVLSAFRALGLLPYQAWISNLINITVPLEALFWAWALNHRYEYLNLSNKAKLEAKVEEMTAQERAQNGQLRELTGQLRDSLDEKTVALMEKDHALERLDAGNRLLRNAQDGLQNIIAASTHGLKNKTYRLRITLEKAGEAPSEALMIHADNQVRDIVTDIEAIATTALNIASKNQYRTAPAVELLQLRVEKIHPRFSYRQMVLDLRINAQSSAEVPDYPFNEAVSELLDNTLRYATAGSAVIVELGQIGDQIVVSVTNEGSIDTGILDELFTQPISRGGGNALNDDTTSGRGLYVVHQLLLAIGGGLSLDSNGPVTRISAKFPAYTTN